MNILNTLTVKHLKLNKKRTIVTIIGVALSAAMMISVTTLVASVQDMLKRSAIERVGNWHGIYNDLTPEQAGSISSNKNVLESMYTKTIGYAKYNDIKNPDKPYIYLKQYDKNALEKIARLKEGRLPQKDSEILIPEHLISNGKVSLSVGNQITLEVGGRVTEDGYELNQSNSYVNNKTENTSEKSLESSKEKVSSKPSGGEKIQNTVKKTYTIVGITSSPDILIEPYSAPGYTAVTYADTKEITSSDKMDIAILLKTITASSSNKLKSIASGENVDFVANADLLMVSGSFTNGRLNTVLYGSTVVIIILIIIGSVALIYNAFSISITDRLKQFGMLSSVGATKKQIRKSVRTEAAIVTGIGLPIGIICGLGGIGLTIALINPIVKSLSELHRFSMGLAVSPISIIAAVLLVIITVWISSVIPSKRAVSISPVEAIRQSADIKINKKSIKTSFVTQKLFGIEGDIALKNLKRNRKKYRATVFSLIISIVLFITVSSFTMYFKKASDIGIAQFNYDANVSVNFHSGKDAKNIGEEISNVDQFFSKIAELEDIDEYSIIIKKHGSTKVNEDVFSKLLLGKVPIQAGQKEFTTQVGIFVLDDKTFKKYVQSIGEDEDKYINPQKPAGILINKVYIQDSKGMYIETEQLNWNASANGIKGKTIDLKYIGIDTSSISIEAATDKLPMGMEYSGSANEIWIVVSRTVGQEITDNYKDMSINANMYLNTKNMSKLNPKIYNIFSESSVVGNLSVFDANEQNNSNYQLLLLASVFIYGFITLITLIGIANIFNTISTNITLRRREFAMLKSVGMTPASFNKMINYESIFYGLKSLLYGLLISFAISFLMYKIFMSGLAFKFMLPWMNIGLCVVGVMIIVFTTMMYSSSKIRKENIIDALRQENI